MKRRIKIKSKKGFTLLEVMLAVVILTMASTMIMQGFLATMGFSTNTSIYSRAGASNYATVLGKLSEFSNDEDDFYTRYVGYNTSTDSSSDYVTKRASGANGLNFNFTGKNLETGLIDVQIWKAADGPEDIDGYNVASGYGYGENTTVADNRQSFFYTPSNEHFYCETCKHWGYIGFFKHGGEKDAKWYCVYPYEPSSQVKVIPYKEGVNPSGKPCCEGRDAD